jgi:hypothetical protein
MLRWKKLRAWTRWIGPYELWASAIMLVAVALRVLLIALGWPQLDSDEGTMGIMGIHILTKGEVPIFFYAQGYMGALEAYLAAAIFSVFGVSTFTLRVGLIFLFALFLVGMYLLTTLLYNKPWALVVLGFLCLGSAPILTRELVAIGGYPETLLFGVMLLLLALWLAGSSKPDFSLRNQRRRLIIYGLWGIIAGVAFWTDALIVPFILTSGLMILVFCWRELLGWATPFLLIGTLIGLFPMIYYNLGVSPELTTWNYLRNIQAVEGIKKLPFHQLFPLQLKGAFLISMPGATGANPLCYSYVWDMPIFDFNSFSGLRCTLMHTGWSFGIILLWLTAVVLCLRTVWQLSRSQKEGDTSAKRRALVLHSGRFILLLNGLLVLLLFLISPASAYFPHPDMRYLVGLLVTTPALLWPLWNGVGTVKPFAINVARVTVGVKLTLVRRALLALIGAVFIMGTFSTFSGYPAAPPIPERQDTFAIIGVYQYLGVPQTQAFNQGEAMLIENLLRIGAVHIYSDYWTCDRIVFRSQEKIICSVARFLKGRLRPGQNRYLPYCEIVRDDPFAAYVFKVGSPEATYMKKTAKGRYQLSTFNGYMVFRPKEALISTWHCV